MQPSSNGNPEQPKVTNNTNTSPNETINKPARRLKLPNFLHNKKGRAISLIIILALITGAAAGIYWYSNNNKNAQDDKDPVVFSINDRKFRASEVNPVLDQAQKYSIDREKAQEGLIEAMKYKIAAEQYGIKITDAQIRDSLAMTSYYQIAKQPEPLDKWLEAIGYRGAIDDYIEKNTAQGKKGYAFVFHFGNLVIPNNNGANLPNFGNKVLAERDRNYAQKKADEYREQLLNGAAPDKVLESAQSDKMLNEDYIEGGSSTVRFGDNAEETWQQQVSYKEVINEINSSTAINKPTVIKTGKISRVSEPTKEEDYSEAFYYFVYMTQNDIQAKQLQDTLSNLKVIKS